MLALDRVWRKLVDMIDPVYAKLAFSGFYVKYTDDSYNECGEEKFELRDLEANGFEKPPTVEEFVEAVTGYWGVGILEIRDRYGRLLFPLDQ